MTKNKGKDRMKFASHTVLGPMDRRRKGKLAESAQVHTGKQTARLKQKYLRCRAHEKEKWPTKRGRT